MIKIINYSDCHYYRTGLAALAKRAAVRRYPASPAWCFVLPGKQFPVSAVLMLQVEVREWDPDIIVLSDDLTPELVALAAGRHSRISVLPARMPVKQLYRWLCRHHRSRQRVARLHFTPCECALMVQLREGWALKRIADDTGRSVKTLSSHKGRIMRKSGVSDNLALLTLLNDPGFGMLLHRQTEQARGTGQGKGVRTGIASGW